MSKVTLASIKNENQAKHILRAMWFNYKSIPEKGIKDDNDIFGESVALPFPGFYCTLYDDIIERMIESEVEYIVGDLLEENIPDDIYLEDYIDFEPIRKHICEQVCNTVDDYISAVLNEILRSECYTLGIVYKELLSPKYYNFSNDVLFAKVPWNSVQIINSLANELWPTFTEEDRNRLSFSESSYCNSTEQSIEIILLAYYNMFGPTCRWKEDVIDALAWDIYNDGDNYCAAVNIDKLLKACNEAGCKLTEEGKSYL